MITLYTLPNCPHCNDVKEILEAEGRAYTVRSMEDPEAITDLRFDGCFEVEAPIIQIGSEYLTYQEFIKIDNKKHL